MASFGLEFVNLQSCQDGVEERKVSCKLPWCIGTGACEPFQGWFERVAFKSQLLRETRLMRVRRPSG